jgi:hypothetical protein
MRAERHGRYVGNKEEEDWKVRQCNDVTKTGRESTAPERTRLRLEPDDAIEALPMKLQSLEACEIHSSSAVETNVQAGCRGEDVGTRGRGRVE